MTLTEALQIKERYLQFEDLRAMQYCEHRWREEGCPTGKWEMINFVEKMLHELQANGIGYPKVLLLRKKEIQRGVFTLPLRRTGDNSERSDTAAPGEICPDCQSRGYVFSDAETDDFRDVVERVLRKLYKLKFNAQYDLGSAAVFLACHRREDR